MPDKLVAAEARFVAGSVLRHVIVMAGTGAIGLIAVFAVDLLNLFYISLLGQRPIAAAIGFAGVVGFFQTSALIGLVIGVGAVVAHNIGAGTARAARHIAGSGLVLMTLTGLIIGFGTVAMLTPILDVLGAAGETRNLAERFLMIWPRRWDADALRNMVRFSRGSCRSNSRRADAYGCWPSAPRTYSPVGEREM